MGNRDILPFFKGKLIKDVQCLDISNMGFGVLKPKNFTIFAKGLIVGEKADVKIEKLSKNYGLAKVLRINNKSKDRIKALCKYAKECNGCKYQHLSYQKQVELKEKQLEALFGYHISIKEADNQFNYRNKSNFTIKNQAYNMYDEFNQLTVIDNCIIAHKKITQIMPYVIEAINNNKKAEIKEVIFRYSDYQDAMMIILVSEISNKYAEKIAQEIIGFNNKVKSIILSIGNSTNYLFNDREKILYGNSYLIEKTFNKLFKITSKSFYQINNRQTEKLYETIINFGDFTITDNVLDLYCGVGSIGIVISDYVNYVLGVEVLDEAVESAKDNIDLNELSNVEIVKTDLNSDYQIDEKFNCVIVDPPRSGLSDSIIKSISASQVEKLIYISCNPITQKRDLDHFKKAGFSVIKHQGLDMFVNTEHVETVVLMSRVDK